MTSSDAQFYFCNAECQAKEQLVPFLKSLLWLRQGLNPKSHGDKADALPSDFIFIELRFYSPVNS